MIRSSDYTARENQKKFLAIPGKVKLNKAHSLRGTGVSNGIKMCIRDRGKATPDFSASAGSSVAERGGRGFFFFGPWDASVLRQEPCPLQQVPDDAPVGFGQEGRQRAAARAVSYTHLDVYKRQTFILATTEAHKFPITIVSRCQHFIFKAIPENELVAHLTRVLGKENIPFEENAVRLLARRAAGSCLLYTSRCV